MMLCTYDNVTIALNILTDGDESTPKGWFTRQLRWDGPYTWVQIPVQKALGQFFLSI